VADSFTHLHVHTEFSMLDGAAKLDELVAAAVADGQPALGMTDHGNMYGVLDFYKECRAQGIKPIIGTEAYMAGESRHDRPSRRGRLDDTGGDVEGGQKLYYHLTLLAENNVGYRNLIKLSSLAFLEGFYYQPRMDWELLERHHEGLIATTGCLGGHVLQSLLRDDYDDARAKAARLQDIFGRDNLFVELQDHGLPNQARTNPMLLQLARELRAPILATNDSHYVHRHDSEAHDALLCIQTNSLISDSDRFHFDGTEHYLKSAGEMRHLFSSLPEACDNTLWIAERSNVEIEFGRIHLPKFPVPDGFADDVEYLNHLAREGARERWGDDLPAAVVERLAYELKVIVDMGFASYFLIVWDLIRHAREAGIRVGPGRGSAAGCAVAYCLRITDIDPIRYELIFERFLNPSRISMPDIDMDFDSRYRDEMIRYATRKYGRDRVAQIITFNTIKARNAVRDAARVLGFDYGVGDRLAKAMPPLVMGRDVPLKYCLEEAPGHESGFNAAADLREMYETDPVARRVVDVAKGLEGLKRSTGIHAAAVVIAPEPLTDFLPIQRKPDASKSIDEAPIVTQYEMHGVEDLGLLKMDFLGLRNLDVITDTVELVRAGVDPDFDIDRIPLDDAKVFELLGRGETVGVFQLESPPMQSLLRAMAPTSFEDVSAVIALYRPGPMGVNMHYDYADRKNGRKKVEYFHDDAAEILGDTYGLMIYQESVMRVAQRFAGYSMAEADNLRKACGKKVRKLMEAEREKFIAGCETTGYGAALGQHLFAIIENFADYAFNKSHSFGYGLVTYQTAYLKAHHPVEYFAALLTSVKDNLDKAGIYLADARKQGVTVRPPDINRSDVDFGAFRDEKAVTFGLSAIRGVGAGVCRKIVAEREARGPFVDFNDYASRVESDCLNKKVVESFIKAGAFASLGHPRQGLLMVFERAVDSAAKKRAEIDQGVLSLFDGMNAETGGGFSMDVEIPDVEFERRVLLSLEKEHCGLYVSDHPLFGYETTLARHADRTIDSIDEEHNSASVILAGVITKVERKFTRRGDSMMILALEDLTGTLEVTVFNKQVERLGHLIREDAVVAIRGRLNVSEERRSLQCNDVIPLVLSTGNPSVRLSFPLERVGERTIDELKQILLRYPGDSPVFLHLGTSKVLRLPAKFNVDLQRAAADLRIAFGIDVLLSATPT